MAPRKKRQGEKFSFVNTTDDPEQERLRHRHLVHSHVSQYRWKQTQKVQTKNQINARAPTGTRSKPEELEAQRVGKTESSNVFSSTLRNPILSYSDPFFPDHQVHDAMSYALKTMWPGLLLKDSTSATWVPAAIADPVLFSACIYGAAVHMHSRLASASTYRNQSTVWRINNETIRRLHLILNDQTRASSDGAIFAVLTLAYNAQHRRGPLNPDPHPRRPLQDLQWLTVYSSLPTNELHVEGLSTMLEMRGGLGQLVLPGLAPLLSYLCLLRASKELAHPVLPFFPLSDEHMAEEESKNPCFTIPHNDLFGRIPAHIQQIIRRMHYYNDLLATYLAGSIETPQMDVFADQRNYIQRALLALPWIEEVSIDPGSAFSELEHETVRVGLLLYSFLVIFPIPFAYGPYDKLRELLKRVITHEATNTLPQHWTLWLVSLGAISEQQAPEKEHGRWFLDTLRDLTVQMAVSGWDDYKLRVQSIMWQDTVLDPFMQRIWISHVLGG